MTNVYKKILTCFLLLISYGLAYSQVNVTGVVKGSDDGNPIPGVSVIIKGNKQGVATDVNGKFHISVPADGVLKFSYVGYVTKEVKVEGRTVIDVTLAVSKSELNDVVVIGYHSTKQRTTTAAVTVISGKEIEDLPAPSLDIALQGKVTGVNIQNFSGQPGVRNTFAVRGNTSLSTSLNEANAISTPLFIIDGVPTSLSDLGNFDNTSTDVLAGININDIESIQIQKDAAATAIWGSRGANGVVVITTKKAKIGKPQINFNIYTGASFKPALMPTASGSEERNEKINFLTTQGGVNSISGLPQMLTDSLNPAFNNATDWQGLLYRTGIIHNEDLSIAGATDKINYRFSLNDYDENGVLYGTGFKRYSFRTNIMYQVTKKFSTEINISFSRLDRQPGLGNYPHTVNPLAGNNQPSSFYYLSPSDVARYHNEDDAIRNVDRNDSFTAFIGLHYQILPNLLFKTETSVNPSTNSNQYSQPSTQANPPIASSSNVSDTYMTTNISNVLSYTDTVAQNHHFGIVAIQTFERDVDNNTSIYGYGVPDDHIQVVQGIPQSGLTATTDYQAASLLSYASQFHYDYKDKYLLDATIRTDASSRFGANHKWGTFPSVSAGYIMSDEDYLKDVKWLSLLKIRGSYGVNGIEPTSFYAPYNNYNLTQGYYNGVAIGTPNFNSGVTNKNLTWQPTKQLDLGVDASFFKNHVDVTLDYYNKITSDMYYTFPLAFYTGYTQQTSNSGLSVGNKGFEVNIDTHNLPSTSKLQWTTNLNFSYNSNKILSLPNGNRNIYATYGDPNSGLGLGYIFEVGKPMYMMNQMIYTGVYNTQSQIPVNPYTGALLTYFKTYYPVKPGYPIWKDVNGDYDVWSDEDKGNAQGDLVPTGNPNPAITGGFNNNFTYKNFSLSIGTTFTLHRDIINTLQSNQFNNWSNGITSFTNAGIPNLNTIGFWNPALAAQNPTGYNAKFPALNPSGAYFYQFFPFSTMFNENGAYFKITNITIGYKLPQKIVTAWGITSCRFYAMLENVATFQKATVPDAEQVDPFGVYDGATYPVPKKATIGVSVQF